MKYVKKPVVIDAMQYVGQQDLSELKIWVETFDVEFRTYFNADANSDILSINTLEETMSVSIGDFVIRGVKGEFYACKPDVFEMTYDKILGENLPEIYDNQIKVTPENLTLADRIAGKIDLYGNPIIFTPIDENEPVKEPPILNDYLSRRIAGEIDEQGNPLVPETLTYYIDGTTDAPTENIKETQEQNVEVVEDATTSNSNATKTNKKKKKK
jgi:hypothetical protein